jgi:hypothetical protein
VSGDGKKRKVQSRKDSNQWLTALAPLFSPVDHWHAKCHDQAVFEVSLPASLAFTSGECPRADSARSRPGPPRTWAAPAKRMIVPKHVTFPLFDRDQRKW